MRSPYPCWATEGRRGKRWRGQTVRETALEELGRSRCVVLKITIVAIVAWSSAFIAAGAFAYTLNSGRVPQNASTTASMPNAAHNGLAASVSPAGPAAHDEARAPIVLTPTVITGIRVRPAILAPPLAHARELSEMNCSGWRQLEQGDPRQQVRSCN
jgi:hypothetical protein